MITTQIDNKHYIECSVVMLPTENPSHLILQNKNKVVFGKELYSITENRQHLYLLSDEEIKELP